MGRHITAQRGFEGLECTPNNRQLDADAYCVDGWCGFSMAVRQIMSSLTTEWGPGIKLINVSDWTIHGTYKNERKERRRTFSE